MKFNDLITSQEILNVLTEEGYETPTPVQEQAIPLILRGVDLRASAQTGTGKTAAFLLPILMRLLTPSEAPGKGPRVLILVPTRELAMQVAKEADKYSRFLTKIKTICIYGGASYQPQYKALSQHHEILVATPGRLIDHMQQKKVNFSRLEVLILDEADRMLDMGFLDAVENIVSAIPKTRQTLLFSATMKGAVMRLSSRLLNNPSEVAIAQPKMRHEQIEQKLYTVNNIDMKYRLLDELLSDPSMVQTIIFTATKRHADVLSDKLLRDGRSAAVLHGGMTQGKRSRTISQVHRGEVKILVATDVAARGIDVSAISHVINFDLPMTAEDYVHRIGRTGRAGATGYAFSLVSPRDFHMVREIEKYTGQKLIFAQTPELKPRAATSPVPQEAPRRHHRSDERRSSPPDERRSFGDRRPASGQKPQKKQWNRWKSKKPRGPRIEFR
jgi:superfamily II DNA/RNA helicase